jgi:hypothetical protein
MKIVLFAMIFLTLAVFLLFGTVSCQNKPMNKEEYMESFNRFVEMIRRDSDSYTPRDWIRLVETYSLYSGPLYERFKPELSLAEQLKVQEYRLHFSFLYQKFQAKEALNRGKGIIDEAGGKIQSIIGEAEDFKNRLRDSLEDLFPRGGE